MVSSKIASLFTPALLALSVSGNPLAKRAPPGTAVITDRSFADPAILLQGDGWYAYASGANGMFVSTRLRMIFTHPRSQVHMFNLQPQPAVSLKAPGMPDLCQVAEMPCQISQMRNGSTKKILQSSAQTSLTWYASSTLRFTILILTGRRQLRPLLLSQGCKPTKPSTAR
jgi:hypothetical protein